MSSGPLKWIPTEVRSQKRKLATYSLTVVVDTDAGEGHLKVLNNKTSPHDLASEYIGTELAQLIGLPTFEYAIIEITAAAPIDLSNGAIHLPGPAFVTRTLDGMKWSGTQSDLRSLVNPSDLGRLVAFDTWTMNCDRYRPAGLGHHERRNADNVYLSRTGVGDGKFKLIAMDQGCCFKCQRDLTPTTLRAVAMDRTLYGLFPEFRGRAKRVDAQRFATSVELITREQVRVIVNRTPRAWLDCDTARTLLVDVIVNRAGVLRSIIDSDFPRADLFDDELSGGKQR